MESQARLIYLKDPMKIWPWDVVPCLQKKLFNLSYPEIYRAMTHFMRSSMIYYNPCQSSMHLLFSTSLNCLVPPYINAVVALPYTPKMLDQFSSVQLFLIARELGMSTR